jgi:hypothetical protein
MESMRKHRGLTSILGVFAVLAAVSIGYTLKGRREHERAERAGQTQLLRKKS